MNVNGTHYRTLWLKHGDSRILQVIDQRQLPHSFVIEDLRTVNEVAEAIAEMHVRGAGLIGATAAYGMYFAAMEASTKMDFDGHLARSAEQLLATRPTAVNLAWAIGRQINSMKRSDDVDEKVRIALSTAKNIADEDAVNCKSIGDHGLPLIDEISKRKHGDAVNILTHCNAGWLAFVDHGTATAPIYAAHDSGIKVHVWVDETRPRNQGARLTAWELEQHGVPYTVIADNTGGHLMQMGKVDLVLTGTDRTTRSGDVANKIGTYLKALAAKDNNIPFYVALPSSSIDWNIRRGIEEIPIEERDQDEVKHIQGFSDGKMIKVLLTPPNCRAANYGFDITPARLVTGLITEKGICSADEKGLTYLFPEHKTDSN